MHSNILLFCLGVAVSGSSTQFVVGAENSNSQQDVLWLKVGDACFNPLYQVNETVKELCMAGLFCQVKLYNMKVKVKLKLSKLNSFSITFLADG